MAGTYELHKLSTRNECIDYAFAVYRRIHSCVLGHELLPEFVKQKSDCLTVQTHLKTLFELGEALKI